MSPGAPTKVIAACCGLTAFTVAIVAGMAAGNPADVVIGRALLCMIGCQILGMIIGAIGERVMAEAVSQYKVGKAGADGKPGSSSSQPSTTPTSGDGVLVV